MTSKSRFFRKNIYIESALASNPVYKSRTETQEELQTTIKLRRRKKRIDKLRKF